ncbi:MAG: N-acetylmuramic acid 6-phosphate etherase [Anaerolineae bacterium]|nr:N-acetylmuramic acid 6-phosphate etherase [Anaerolineae bacterium]
MITEQQNPRTLDVDQLSTLDIVTRINAEDWTVAEAVARALPTIAQAVDAIVVRLRDGGRLFYVGAGTSGRLGILDAVECVPTYNTPPQLVQGLIAGGEAAFTRSIEGVEDDMDAARRDLMAQGMTARDAVVGIAASGQTPYALGALNYAREQGALTVGISCNEPAPLLDAADIAIAVVTGPEVITGSTRMKAGTAQKMVLNMLSTTTMVKLGKVYGNLMVDVQVKNEKLLLRARRIVAQVGHVETERAAELLAAAHDDVKVAIVMARRGVNAETARSLLSGAGGLLRQVID